MPRIEMARLALASEKPDTCTGLPRLPSGRSAEQEARVRYEQDLAEFIPITDGARLI